MINNFEVYKQIEWLSEGEIVEKISDFLSANEDIINTILLEYKWELSKEPKVQTSDLTDLNALSLCTLWFLFDIKTSNEKVETLIVTISDIQKKIKNILSNRV
jgi:hypothetical protein